jgi:hypothetical protein
MNRESLPPNLRDLETQLTGRTYREPPGTYRARVLEAMANAPTSQVNQAGRRWNRLWQAAAAVILALNLGMSAANGVRFQSLNQASLSGGNSESYTVLRKVSGAFEGDDCLLAFAERALAKLKPAPDVGVPGRNFLSNKENGEWDMP